MMRIAVLTSGGDKPGMNAAIRGVTRTALDRAWTVFGVRHGYAGLIGGQFVRLGARNAGGIVQGAARCSGAPAARSSRRGPGAARRCGFSRRQASRRSSSSGGNGSQTGAHGLSAMGLPVVGVASTIDNDLYGSDIIIGVDTALEVIDRLRTTAPHTSACSWWR